MKKRKIALISAFTLGMTIIPKTESMAVVYNSWKQSNGNWYYYSNNSMCTGWVKDGSSWYYMNSDGTMKTGWVKSGGSWYYLKDNGVMATGWIRQKNLQGNDLWYYLNSNGSMATGWINDNGTWYYLRSDGVMETGMFEQGGKKYCLASNGAMKTGWFKYYNDVDDTELWYYAESDGSLKTGWFDYQGQWYYLSEEGSLASYIYVDGCYVNKDGIWDQSPNENVIVTLNRESYDINVLDRIIGVKVINNTDKTVKCSKDFLVEKYESGKWTTVSTITSDGEKDSEVLSKTYKLLFTDFMDFRNRITAGSYRLGVKIDGEYVYSEFSITGERKEKTVEFESSKHDYYLNESKSIPFSIINNTDRNISYESNYSIEKFMGSEWKVLYGGTYEINKSVKSQWRELPLKNNGSENKNYEVKAGVICDDSIELSNIDEKLTPGCYRIKKIIDGKERYLEFRLSNDNIVKMKTKNESYWKKTDEIELTIENTSSKELVYGKNYRIEKSNGKNGWIKVPLKDDRFTEEAILLEPKSKSTQIIKISNIDEENMYGDYRIVKVIDGNEYYAEFLFGYDTVEY